MRSSNWDAMAERPGTIPDGAGPEPRYRVMANTYALLSLTLLFTALTAHVSLSLHLGIGGCMLSTLGGLFFLLVTMLLRDSVFGLVAVFGFTGLEGLGLGQVLSHYLQLPGGTSTVALAAGLAGIVFVSLSVYVHVTRQNFSARGGMLFAGLSTVVVAAFLGNFIRSHAIS